MTDKLFTVFGILLFALVTAILYVWGLSKTYGQQERMAKLLLINCKNKVIKYLKKHEVVTEKQIESLIKGVSAGEFWSKKRLTVQDPHKFSSQLIAFMTEQLYIVKNSDGSFSLKK
ncbi:MAG: hypothetical protein IJN39_06070 [Clostridia bacterium]|nr:hypothetical protein [Clostridia bacterium]